MDQWQSLRTEAIQFGNEPLLHNGATTISLAEGYIELLTHLSLEDKAAKGLRKVTRQTERDEAVYVTALEAARDSPLLLLTGPTGSGKTSFAKHLAFTLVTGAAHTSRQVIRNESGNKLPEVWPDAAVLPSYYSFGDVATSTEQLLMVTLPGLITEWRSSSWSCAKDEQLLIILDEIEKVASPNWLRQLDKLVASCRSLEGKVRFLLLANSDLTQTRSWPSGFAQQKIIPLLRSQRRSAATHLLKGATEAEQNEIGSGQAAALPTVFALCLSCRHIGDSNENTIDAWISSLGITEADIRQILDEESEKHSPPAISADVGQNTVSEFVRQLLLGRYLVSQPPDVAISLFRNNPTATKGVIQTLLARLVGESRQHLVRQLIQSQRIRHTQYGALLAAPYLNTEEDLVSTRAVLLGILTEGSLSVAERDRAGRLLSLIGDDRDLLALANVPGGLLIMGSESHPNSSPTHQVQLEDFQIGVYPVVNREYLKFTRETGRFWASPDAADKERQNAPATDLTWHDARAYCRWLTGRWRRKGHIGQRQHIRLPTEPQWERACRGNIAGVVVYPWGTEWEIDRANSDEVALNDRCAVGMFPKGCSPYGCHDMTGQVWEWCSTLWGTDMATPSFLYPWTMDGREETAAGEDVRRVLRGGCFSSGALKANATYRGSLEPGGSWRGNGFRIAVVYE